MPFIWDESKREANLAKHGLDFADAPKVFDDPYAWSGSDLRYSDDRFTLIGKLGDRLIVLVAYTEPKPETFRIISMRKATRREADRYEQEKANRLPSLKDPISNLLDQLDQERKKE